MEDEKNNQKLSTLHISNILKGKRISLSTHDNGAHLVLNQKEWMLITTLLKNAPMGRYTRRELKEKFQIDFPCGVVKGPEKTIWAIPRCKSFLKSLSHSIKLGVGAFGHIKLMQNINTGEWVVAKTQKVDLKNKTDSKQLEEVTHNEFEILTRFNEGYAKCERHSNKNFHIKKYIFVMPYKDGIELFNLLKDSYDLRSRIYFWTTFIWLEIVIAILKSLINLHENGIFHCDIKPENIIIQIIKTDADSENLFDYKFIAHIIDFGLSLIRSKDSNNHYQKEITMNVARGSLDYVDPILYTKPIYSEKQDIYSLGKIFKLIWHIAAIPRLKFIMACMIAADPEHRPSLKYILKEVEKIHTVYINHKKEKIKHANSLLQTFMQLEKEDMKKAFDISPSPLLK